MTAKEKKAAAALAKTDIANFKTAAATAKGKWDTCSKAAAAAKAPKKDVLDADC